MEWKNSVLLQVINLWSVTNFQTEKKLRPNKSSNHDS